MCTGDSDSFLLMQQSDQAQSEDAAAKPLIWDSGPIHREAQKAPQMDRDSCLPSPTWIVRFFGTQTLP